MSNQEFIGEAENRLSPNQSSGNTINNYSKNNNDFTDTSMISQMTELDASRADLTPKSSTLPNRNSNSNSSFKEQKKSYIMKKKFVTQNIQSALESTLEVHSGWLKARTSIKNWIRVWCQVKPGYLIMYTSQEAQKKHRLGVVMIAICQAIQRPTKKEGYCFKLINPFGCSIWVKSSTRALLFPQSSLALRASDKSVGKVWLDALQRCNLSSNLDGDQSSSNLDVRNSRRYTHSELSDSEDGDTSSRQLASLAFRNASNDTSFNNSLSSLQINNNNNCFNDSEHFRLGTGINIVNNNNYCNDTAASHRDNSSKTNINSGKMVAKFGKYSWRELRLECVHYVDDGLEELGSAGVQKEEVHDSNKNFLWHILKQLRPGMDLSKVTLPTFILEPRSFLEKLADYYYHCDILSEAVVINDPVLRLIEIVKWYLSGFYKKPKGPKKPYNPILGEKFRCFWDQPKTQSRTFFVAEQVSHHPPISAFHVSNRKDGYSITCALLSRSKFNGISVSAILDGKARLYLNKRDEAYSITLPLANCRGILLGSLCLELGGKVEIDCIQTGCRCELDFKLAPVWANASSYNSLTGKIFQNNKVTHTLDGHWDKRIFLTDKNTNSRSILWEVTDKIMASRLKRYTVSVNDQGDRESVKLWSKVTEALNLNDQVLATTEKTRLEDMQRKEARERKAPFSPELFRLNQETKDWSYKWQDDRCWDERRDVMQFEKDFKIQTLMISKPSTGYNPLIDQPLNQLNKLPVSSETNKQQESFTSPFADRGESNEVNPLPSNTASNQNSSGQDQSSKQPGLIHSSEAALQIMESQEEEAKRMMRKKRRVALIFASVLTLIFAILFRHFV